ncbi:uncharacterized protein LOC121598837 [Anopheles merus]|uniref:uncharacterized protein LOC121598837 n=1 Tax=Anopheles merus TaxID=30066 RepID=UPI001BE426F0|nr:uncharacterized protein LOC121598837 [Anopheles merus]
MGMLTDPNMYEEEYDEAAEMLVVYDPEPEIDSNSSILQQKTPLDEHSYFFSAERTLELIAIVESEPLLWDKTQLDYKNVKMTENAWRMVASKMELDVEVCKEKWTCLRAQFRKLKRRMMQSSQNGTGTDEIYQPSWYAYEAMAFLNEAVECEGDTNTVDGNNTKYCTANTKPKPTLDEYAHSLSRENTLELVSIIEGLPVLWDRANRDNKYAKKADDAWKEVARKMSVDVDVCKEKWAAMRAQYRRIRGKVLQSTSKEGSGSDQIYRPSWYAYEAMTFLNRTMDYGKASNTTYRNIPEGTDATFVENNYFLSNENTLEFIAVVESHPLLWNKAHPDYGNVKRLEDTWQLVADEMDLDVEDCKDKWNSLRAQFRRLRRKILQSSEDAKESDQIYQPSWYAYDAMTFLTDVIQHGKARKRRLSSPRPKPEPQSNSYAPRSSTVRKNDDGFFLDSLEILNADDDEDQEQLSSIDGSPYPSDDEEEEYLEEQEQLLAGEDSVERLEQTCDGAEDPPQPTEEAKEASSRQPCDSERQRIAPFIEILSQRLLRKEKAQLEEIENELLKVLNKYPNARID